MSTIRVGFVDVYCYRRGAASLEYLLLHRAAGQVRPGSWEGVHGRIDAGETPVAAALRELHEETGCDAERFYNLSRVEQIYLHGTDEVILVPAFAARLAPEAKVVISTEHDEYEWLPLAEAQARCSWPRAARALADLAHLFGGGSLSAIEDVLRIVPPSPMPHHT